MKTKIKSSIIYVLFFLMLATLFLAGIVSGGVKADAAEEENGQVFEMVDSYRIRTDDNGFYFTVKMSEDVKNKIATDDSKNLYFILMPKSYFDACDTHEEAYTHYLQYKTNGEVDEGTSNCLYIKVNGAYSGGDGFFYANGGVANVKQGVNGDPDNRELVYSAVALIETKTDANNDGVYELAFEFAKFQTSGKPQNTLYDTVTSAFYEGSTIADIKTVYDWFGTEDFPVPVDTIDDYNALVALNASNKNYVKSLYYKSASGITGLLFDDDSVFTAVNAITSLEADVIDASCIDGILEANGAYEELTADKKTLVKDVLGDITYFTDAVAVAQASQENANLFSSIATFNTSFRGVTPENLYGLVSSIQSVDSNVASLTSAQKSRVAGYETYSILKSSFKIVDELGVGADITAKGRLWVSGGFNNIANGDSNTGAKTRLTDATYGRLAYGSVNMGAYSQFRYVGTTAEALVGYNYVLMGVKNCMGQDAHYKVGKGGSWVSLPNGEVTTIKLTVADFLNEDNYIEIMNSEKVNGKEIQFTTIIAVKE